jgi:hypothetical protein
MEGFDLTDLKSVRQSRAERAEKARQILPINKSAQKEYIRDFLARNQEKFEECMNQLAEYDPKTFVTIYKDLSKHMIPKQSEVSVTHGLDQDFKELAALSVTKIEGRDVVGISSVPEIQDTDFEELKELENGGS